MDARTPEAPREGFRKGAEQRRQTCSAAARFLWRGPGYEACSASATAQTRAAGICRTRESRPGNREGTGIAAGAGVRAGTLGRWALSPPSASRSGWTGAWHGSAHGTQSTIRNCITTSADDYRSPRSDNGAAPCGTGANAESSSNDTDHIESDQRGRGAGHRATRVGQKFLV